jgi:hypothetical protein
MKNERRLLKEGGSKRIRRSSLKALDSYEMDESDISLDNMSFKALQSILGSPMIEDDGTLVSATWAFFFDNMPYIIHKEEDVVEDLYSNDWWVIEKKLGSSDRGVIELCDFIKSGEKNSGVKESNDKDSLNDLVDATKYGVIRTGGSIGDKEAKPIPCDSREEAKLKAKRMNAQLSKGDKEYYKMRYKVVKMKGPKNERKLLKEREEDYAVPPFGAGEDSGDTVADNLTAAIVEIMDYASTKKGSKQELYTIAADVLKALDRYCDIAGLELPDDAVDANADLDELLNTTILSIPKDWKKQQADIRRMRAKDEEPDAEEEPKKKDVEESKVINEASSPFTIFLIDFDRNDWDEADIRECLTRKGAEAVLELLQKHKAVILDSEEDLAYVAVHNGEQEFAERIIRRLCASASSDGELSVEEALYKFKGQYFYEALYTFEDTYGQPDGNDEDYEDVEESKVPDLYHELNELFNG